MRARIAVNACSLGRRERRHHPIKLAAFAAAIAAAGVIAPVSAQQGGQFEFQSGVDAYRAGDTDAALAAFLAAYAQGLRSPNLDFNIGLSYYRLGRYAEAQTAFARLTRNPDYSAIAQYHLGLAAARLGQYEQAARDWQVAETRTTSANLRSLIQLARRRLEPEAPPPRTGLNVSASIGYDSDPALLSETLQLNANQKADAFADLAAGLDYPLASGTSTDLDLRGSVYARQYRRDTDFNQQGGQLAVRYAFGEDWRTAVSAEAASSFFGGDNLDNAGSIVLETARQYTGSTLRFHYRASRVAGGSAYAYLDGWRQCVGGDYAFPLAAVRTRLDYEFEVNNRRDLRGGGEFFSESPMRHSVGVQLRHDLDERLSLEGRARYRYDRYRDPDQVLVGSTPIEQRRIEKLAQFGLGTRLRFSNAWSGLLEYQYSRNQSNFSGYAYQRHLVALSIEWGS